MSSLNRFLRSVYERWVRFHMASSPDPYVRLANELRNAAIDACIDIAGHDPHPALATEVTGASSAFWLAIATRLHRRSRERFKLPPQESP